jgi:hypothetical protein
MTSITLISLMTQYLMLQCFAALCVIGSFTSPNETRKERDITKLEPLGHSETQNTGSSTYVDEFTVKATIRVIQNFQQMSETNITTFTIKYNKF